jgi:hypothetical protein
MSKKPKWHTWANGDDVMMQAIDPAKHGGGILIYEPDGSVRVMFNEAAQVMKDYDQKKESVRATIKQASGKKRDPRGTQFDFDFLFISDLLRSQSQGIDIAALASDPHSDQSNRYLANVFAGHAWRLLAMVASGDSATISKLAKMIDRHKEISQSDEIEVKALYEVAGFISKAAEEKREELTDYKPPSRVEIENFYRMEIYGKLDVCRVDWREPLAYMGFAWLG